MYYFSFYSVANTVVIKLNTAQYASEIRWEITEACGSNNQEYSNDAEYFITCNLPPGLYTLQCLDSYADGWDGATIEIQGMKYCEKFTNGGSMSVSVLIQLEGT